MARPSRRSKLLLRRTVIGAAITAMLCALVSTPAQAEVRPNGDAGGTYTLNVMSWAEIPFRTTIRQQYDYSCGSAAVATLLKHHYGVDIDEGQAFKAMYDRGDQTRIQQVGFSMLDMKTFLESQGFQADGFRLTLDRLAELRVPGIALIVRDGYRHFVVVKGVRGDEILLGDPTFGLRIMKRAEFEGMWNGIILAVRRTAGNANPFGFNRVEEWTPWSRAPISDAARGDGLLTAMPMDQIWSYQISPWRDGAFTGQ